jgi:ligand-binding sensor domain-containing protein
MFQAKDSSIWIDTGSQIKVFDGSAWNDIKIARGNQVDFFSETDDGLVWVSSSMLSYYDPKTGNDSIVVPLMPRPKIGAIGPVFQASDGAIWYNQQVDGEGIVRLDRSNGYKQIWTANDGFRGFVPIPQKYLQMPNGSIWVGTWTGVYMLDGPNAKTWQTWTFPREADNDKFDRVQGDYRVLDMIIDHVGHVWVVFNRAGVAMWDGHTWQSVGNFEFPLSPLSIFEDSSGVIWIGSRDVGVTKYSRGVMKEYPKIYLTTFLETNDRQLFGGGLDGLFLYDPNSDQWKPYPSSQ